jgi:hypothetical protein
VPFAVAVAAAERWLPWHGVPLHNGAGVTAATFSLTAEALAMRLLSQFD